VYAYWAGHRALVQHAARIGIDAAVLPVREEQYYRLKRSLPSDPPLVSIIIPTRDKLDVLRKCVLSILSKTDYAPFEIVIADNGSVEPETLRYFSELSSARQATIIGYDRPFNYSAINNFAVRVAANGSLICLLNNDIEVINGDWLSEMVSHAIRPDVGCVGAKLYYPNDTIQHAGVILGLGGVAGHSHKHSERESPGYYGRLMLVHNVSAVTAACLVVRKSVYLAAGGLDEDNLAVAFNDVDFCLRVKQLGYRHVWTPFAELYHHESVSRGPDSAPGALERFQREISYMKKRWRTELQRDSYYSVNLTLDREDFSLAG
jgi:GT2 family glycosyltransferase